MRRVAAFAVLVSTCLGGLASHPDESASAVPAVQQAYVIAVPPVMGVEAASTRWGHIARYLEESIPGARFTVLPLALHEVIPAAQRGEIDFVVHNPLLTTWVIHGAGGRLLATLQPLSDGVPTSRFGGVIVVRSDNDEIRSLEDLRGTRFAAVAELSFGGWLVARKEMYDLGIGTGDLEELYFTGLPHQRVIDRVLSGNADAGSVRTGVIEELEASGQIERGALRVVRSIGDTSFPQARSTRLYPEFAATAMPGVPEATAKEVAVQLLRMRSDHPAAVAAEIHGWSTAFDATDVSDLLRSFGLPPFEREPLPKLGAQIVSHPYAPGVATLLACIALCIGGYLRLRNRQLKRVTLELSAVERTLRSFVEHTPAAVAMVDTEMRYLVASRGWYEQYGLPDEAIIGRSHYEVFPTIPDRWRKIHDRCLRGESMSSDRDSFEREDGGTTWVQWRIEPWMTAEGEMGGLIMFFEVIDSQIEREAALESALEMQDEMGRAARIGCWAFDIRTKEVSWSDEVCRIHGVAPGGAPDFESAIGFYAPDDRQRVIDALEDGIATGRPWDLEAQLDRVDGRRIWVRALGQVVRDRDGAVVSLRGSFQDITEQVESRRQLEDLQDRFERAIAGTPDGLWDLDHTTGQLWTTDQYKRLIGLTDDDFETFGGTVDAFWDLVHPDDLAATRAAINAHLYEGVPYDVEYRLNVKGRGYRWFRARGTTTRDDAGLPLRRSGSLADIHDQRVNEGRLRLATQAAKIGLWDWDVETGETFFNEIYHNQLGYSAEEWDPSVESWSNSLHPDDRDRAYDDVRRHFEGASETYVNEHRLRCKDGSWRWFRAFGELVERLPDGSPKRMIGLSVDIEHLRDAIEQSESASRAKSEFLANMSHELRTPLTAVIGYADLLANDFGGLPREAAGIVSRIQASSDHLLSVINDILDVSKIEAGRMSLEIMPTDPVRIVEETASIAGAQAGGKPLAIRVRYESPIPARIETDPTRLRQILLNLTSNAVKFTESGSITIAVSCDPDARLLTLRVRDTGIGLTPAQVETLSRFEAFTQADSSTSRRHGGTGLGLRIANSLVSMLGGSIAIDSVRGEGTTVTATVATGDLGGVALIEPVSVPSRGDGGRSADAVADMSEAASGPLRGVRVLLAEDSPDNQRLITHFLRKAGATISVCGDGQAAVHSVTAASESIRPHLVLMDMQMPILDGYNAARRIRGAGSTIPIIAVTAHAMEGDREKCLNAGCDDYTTKPVNRRELIEKCVMWSRRALGESDAA